MDPTQIYRGPLKDHKPFVNHLTVFLQGCNNTCSSSYTFSLEFFILFDFVLNFTQFSPSSVLLGFAGNFFLVA